MTIILSIDVMSGDQGADITIPACLKFLRKFSNTKLLLVGDETIIKKHLGKNEAKISNRIEIIHTTEVVAMDELPQSAMRNKKNSSMRIAIEQVKSKKANAAVSAGNTGALMAIARYLLRTMEGIDRPAIAKLIPTISGEVCVLDLGANVECEPEHLYQFGIMGTQLMKAITKKRAPSIGLLNIGSEDIKGHENIKKAAEIFKKSSLNFYGNVEGDDINKGTVDIIVCDGFTGNVALKTIEGVAKMISSIIRKEFTKNFSSKIMALCAALVIKRVKKTLDPRKYNGAVLIGLNGLVIKSHGGADEIAFYYALEQAYFEAHEDVVTLLEDYLKNNQHVLEDYNKELKEFDDLSML